MGTTVANGLGMMLSAMGLLLPPPVLGGGGLSKAVANSLYPPLVNSSWEPIHYTSSGPVVSPESVNLPSAAPIVNDSNKDSLKITALPNELVVNILAKLTIRDLLVCKHVCKNWQTLVTTVPALAIAAYRGCHPAGYVPKLNDAIKSYHGSLRQWLNSFSEQGSKAVTRLDGLLASDQPHFSEQLFFAIASVLDETPAFDCHKVCTIEHSEFICRADFSPDEQHLISYAGHTLQIYRFVDGCWQYMDTFQQPTPISYVSFSPNSQHMAIRLGNGRATIWRIADGQWQQQTNWYPVSIYRSPLFNIDTTHLMNVSINDNSQIHKLIDGQWQPQVIAFDHHSVWGASFHPQEPNLLATYCNNAVTLWRFWDGQWQQDGTLLHALSIGNIYFSPDGNRLMTHLKDPDQDGLIAKVNNIHIWHRVGREWRKEAVLFPADAGYTARFSPCGHYILTTAIRCQSRMEIWHFSGGQWQEIKTLPPKHCVSGSFSPGEHHLATLDRIPNAIIWRCMDGLLHKEAVIPNCVSLRGIHFSPHGNHVVAASGTKTATIWGIVAGRWQRKATLPHADELCSIKFSPHGNYVLTTQDSTVTVWSLNHGDVTH